MYGRAGLDRFKKAQTLEPFSVNSASKPTTQPAPKATASNVQSQSSHQQIQYQNQHHQVSQKPVGSDVAPPPTAAGATMQQQQQHVTQVGGGQSSWQPPDWAIEPRPGVYYLEVMKEGEVLDRIDLDKRKHIFGRQFHTCDFVLDHQSVSRQHAAVVPHKNGSIYVIDLGSAHGTFVANERLAKDSPVELEAGQSLRFAASTRIYFLRKNSAALFPPPPPTEINLPAPPDPSDEDAVVAYNTFLNRYGLPKSTELSSSVGKEVTERASKRIRRTRVAFRDQVGGELVEVVGISDGADVETEPGPLGVKEGSLVGKYESLVQTTVIPKGKDISSTVKEVGGSPKGVTDKLQQVLNKVRTGPKTGIYDDLYGESLSGKVGSSWAYSSSVVSGDRQGTPVKVTALGGTLETRLGNDDDSDDDLFG